MNTKQYVALGLLVAAAATFFGWSRLSDSDTDGRIGVSGRVTYNGDSPESGRIQFTPDKTTSGPAVAASITNGVYDISVADGLLPGTYEVKVTLGPSLTKEEVMRGIKSGGKKTERAVYRWPTPQVISPGKAEVEFNFDLRP